MLHCENLTVVTADGNEILHGAKASFEAGKMHAVIGPSGCGKTTLMKAMLGMIEHSAGTSAFNGEKINAADELAGTIGFVPQFTLAHNNLSVAEALDYAAKIGGIARGNVKKRRDEVLRTVGLTERAGTRVGALSGGQLRRLGLALELVLSPSFLVCDEVTSGLDPNSENEMLALMRQLVQNEGKAVICIIHNLIQMSKFDTVTVVLSGNVVFQGSPDALLQYFSIKNFLDLYAILHSQPVEFWRSCFEKYVPASATGTDSAGTSFSQNLSAGTRFAGTAKSRKIALNPSTGMQFLALFSRRWKLFFRDTGYLALTLAITFGFPLIVTIFALDGIPEIQKLDLTGTFSIASFNEAVRIKLANSQVATLTTGLVLFQVILLALMGANNGGREIAGERALYEKERMLGLKPPAYALSKVVFTSIIAIFQGVWMCGFVKLICQFPGDWAQQLAIMAAVCLAMTLVCLGFSALLKSAEKASLLTIYLVGFQLPLSGIVLDLPDALTWVFRPFVNAFWGWSGFFDAMHKSDIYDAYTQMNAHAEIFDFSTCLLVLVIQAFVGITMVLAGTLQHQRD